VTATCQLQTCSSLCQERQTPGHWGSAQLGLLGLSEPELTFSLPGPFENWPHMVPHLLLCARTSACWKCNNFM
jgi:hypothetical protein